MAKIPKIKQTHLEAICGVIGKNVGGPTSTEIGNLLQQYDIVDPLPKMTKRQRLFAALRDQQERDDTANKIIAFLQTALDPARFVGRPIVFEELRGELNKALAFCGLRFRNDGRFEKVEEAMTIGEAHERAGRVRNNLSQRGIHHDVIAVCRTELLQENYFHAVFEAAKGIAEKLRQKTGLASDGAELIDRCFGLSSPILAINSLRTETERSEQKGFGNLLKGVFGTFRNVTAHAPKVTLPISEQDALDMLSLLSYLHRRLDGAVTIPRMASEA